MTLENLLRIGKLKAHAVEKVEVERLFAAADRALRDTGNEALGADTRFGLAYRAIVHSRPGSYMGR